MFAVRHRWLGKIFSYASRSLYAFEIPLLLHAIPLLRGVTGIDNAVTVWIAIWPLLFGITPFSTVLGRKERYQRMTTTVFRVFMIVCCLPLILSASIVSIRSTVDVDVEITTISSTNAHLTLNLRGSRDEPIKLDLGTGFTTDSIETRTFNLGKGNLCEFFSYHLTLAQPGRIFDDWSGNLKIWIDSVLVTDTSVSINTPGGTSTSWWAGNSSYIAHCGDPAISTWAANLHRVDFQVTTGADGTMEAPTLSLRGNFSAGLFPISPRVGRRGFAPGTTVTYSYYVPLRPCQITGVDIHQWVNPWIINDYSIAMDGMTLIHSTKPITVAPDTPYHQNFVPPHCW